MVKARNAMIFFAVAVLVMTVAKATTHIVGDAEGWTTGVDYTSWASNNPIEVGDTIVFSYLAGYHSVLHVTKEDYDSCTTTSPIDSDNSGFTSTTILTEGIAYIICGTSAHCKKGMKLVVQTTGYTGLEDSPPPPASNFKSPPSETSPPPPTSKSRSPPLNGETTLPPPAVFWKPNSAQRFSSYGSFVLTFLLMILVAF